MATVPSAGPPDDLQSGQPALPKGLLLVSTPIGNLGDMTARARSALEQADVVLCEDTRHAGRLAAAFDIRAKLEPLHDHNEQSRIQSVLARLSAGNRIALISDAGTPVVSDPGYRLVRAAIAAELPVTAIPGANAAVTALILSGLPPQPFLFFGFSAPKRAARLAQFAKLRSAEQAGVSATLVFYEAPHRLLECLQDLCQIFGATRQSAVARELTKRFETVQRATLLELVSHYEQEKPRGEITIVVGPPGEEMPPDIDEYLRHLLPNHSVKDAVATVSAAIGVPRKTVYARALALMAEPTRL
jgi:16S rRNA (cytidine1402-2'-O)-methyltransferase